MIDIHTHILFGLDDGCNTIEQSIQSLKRAEEIGVTDVILTPHFARRRMYNPEVTAIQANYEELLREVNKHNIHINLYLGSEVDEEDGFMDLLDAKQILTLNNTKYVLMDFAMREVDIDDILYEMIIKGYQPIVAHPERYDYIDDIDVIKTWKNTGALIQINSSSLESNPKIKKKVNYIIKNQLADFIATDSHGKSEAYMHHKKAYEYISKKTSKEYADAIFKERAVKLLSK